MKKLIKLAIIMLVLIGSAPGRAAPTIVNFSGTIFASNWHTGSINGETIFGSMTYNLLAAPQNVYPGQFGPSSSVAAITFSGAPVFGPSVAAPDISAAFTIPQGTFSTASSIAQYSETDLIRNGGTFGINEFGITSEWVRSDSSIGYLNLFVNDSLGTASAIFTNPSAGLSLMQPINWNAAGATLVGAILLQGIDASGSYSDVANFRLDSLTVTPVPEPETYAMMLAGLGLLAFIGRRRK